MVRAKKHNINFDIFLTSDEWSVESLESEFDYLDIELAEKNRKENIRKQAVEKVKNTLTTEEYELLFGVTVPKCEIVGYIK